MMTVAVIALSGIAPSLAGCPNQFHKLDAQAVRATDGLNTADVGSRCFKARELVGIEQRLVHFVEQYQVQCVLDQEVVDVQRRRLDKARAARDQACRP